jgi:hypothetical protein
VKASITFWLRYNVGPQTLSVFTGSLLQEGSENNAADDQWQVMKH